ncbi:unnamed protein product [Candida verbasci]|uniref:Increased recombination centers protein 22 n=1 Tax=Candida verbasci TaxID=1227364 RepID=A0A9W4XLG5_9ASCO|nr:unnamed protein product [Candida verbasci]
MKFSSILSTIALITSTVIAYETTGNEVVDIVIDYSIKENPEISKNDVATWTNGDEVTLEYILENQEKSDITIIGVTGQFQNPVTNQIVTNLTTGKIGPITVASGEAVKFDQKINVDLIASNYELIPQIFIAHEDLIKVIPCRGQLMQISDKSISLFDPRLLFLELVLLVSFIGLAYVVYEIWGKQYLKFNNSTTVKVKKTAAKPAAVSQGSTTSGYDVNWIPEGHLKAKKSKKVN